MFPGLSKSSEGVARGSQEGAKRSLIRGANGGFGKALECFAQALNTFGNDLGSPAGTVGKLWGCFGDALGGFGDALGMLWEALGMLWEALGRLWEALGRPAARRRTKKQLYTKMLGVNKLPINQLCWPNVIVI